MLKLKNLNPWLIPAIVVRDAQNVAVKRLMSKSYTNLIGRYSMKPKLKYYKTPSWGFGSHLSGYGWPWEGMTSLSFNFGRHQITFFIKGLKRN